jgi:tetratricopeptide (TPR) repeat protein
LNPDDVDIYLNLGNVFFEKGSYDNALIVYKKALESSPHNARLHCNLGYLYWGKGNIEEAIKEYEKAIKYDNTYDIAYNNLGVIYLDDLGRIQKAIELFEAARKYNPNKTKNSKGITKINLFKMCFNLK